MDKLKESAIKTLSYIMIECVMFPDVLGMYVPGDIADFLADVEDCDEYEKGKFLDIFEGELLSASKYSNTQSVDVWENFFSNLCINDLNVCKDILNIVNKYNN